MRSAGHPRRTRRSRGPGRGAPRPSRAVPPVRRSRPRVDEDDVGGVDALRGGASGIGVAVAEDPWRLASSSSWTVGMRVPLGLTGLCGPSGTEREGVRMATRGRPRSFDADAALDRAVDVFWRQATRDEPRRPDGRDGHHRPSLYAAFGNKEETFKKAIGRYAEVEMAYVGTPRRADRPRRGRALPPQQRRRGDHPWAACRCLSIQGGLPPARGDQRIVDFLAESRRPASSGSSSGSVVRSRTAISPTPRTPSNSRSTCRRCRPTGRAGERRRTARRARGGRRARAPRLPGLSRVPARRTGGPDHVSAPAHVIRASRPASRRQPRIASDSFTRPPVRSSAFS